MKKVKKFIAFVCCIFLFLLTPKPALACIEGLYWGMDISSVQSHLGVALQPLDTSKTNDLYKVKNLKISNLPVISLCLRIEDEHGLRQLAYEMEYENMTEVLAGLRFRFGPPVETNVEIDGRSPHQQWIWHTGEDVITAIKSDQSPFLLSYKPSLLDPYFLG